MLTVKLVSNNGDEAIHQAADVRYSNSTVYFTTSDGIDASVSGGIVYVMNDAGKTVSVYNIS